MADVYKRLNTTRTFTSGSGTTIYTVPASTTALIRKVQISNNTANAASAKLHHVESGGSADATNVILPTTALGVSEHGMDDAPFAMSEGDTIAAYGDGVSAISISIYGMEVTE